MLQYSLSIVLFAADLNFFINLFAVSLHRGIVVNCISLGCKFICSFLSIWEVVLVTLC